MSFFILRYEITFGWAFDSNTIYHGALFDGSVFGNAEDCWVVELSEWRHTFDWQPP